MSKFVPIGKSEIWQKNFKESLQRKMSMIRKSEGVGFMEPFLKVLSQIKVFHWQTFGYAEHKALDEYYSSMSGLIDSFMETYMGRYGRVLISTPDFSIQDYSESTCKDFIETTCLFLQSLHSNTSDSHLKNILDEMKAATDKLKYLLTLR